MKGLFFHALLLSTVVSSTCVHISAKYLKDTIENLKIKLRKPLSRYDSKDATAQSTTIQTPLNGVTKDDFVINMSYEDAENNYNIADDKQDSKVPPLQLTKAELAMLFRNAMHKGNTVKFDPGDGANTHLTAAVHELPPGFAGHSQKATTPSANDGFYYYYYPLKSFINEISSAVGQGSAYSEAVNADKSSNQAKPSPLLGQQAAINHQSNQLIHNKEPPHIYHHQHSVQFEQVPLSLSASPVESYKKKGFLEPLYMALSGFIGMTVMFILSALVLPKFQGLKPKRFLADDQFTPLSRTWLQAIERYDCNNRIACGRRDTTKAFGSLKKRSNRL